MATLTYLEEHPPKLTQYRSKRRANVSGAIVVHTAECNHDFESEDLAAEGVARFISNRTDHSASYHSVVDSDSIVRVGKYEWEMFHEGTGGNRYSLGLSFACKTTTWAVAPSTWIQDIISNGAQEAFNMAQWVKSTTGIVAPASRINKVEYINKVPGFISHAELDPSRRSDPGKDFPWEMFLDKYRRHLEMFNLRTINDLESFQTVDWAFRFYLGRTISPEEMKAHMAASKVTSLSELVSRIANSEEASGRK